MRENLLEKTYHPYASAIQHAPQTIRNDGTNTCAIPQPCAPLQLCATPGGPSQNSSSEHTEQLRHTYLGDGFWPRSKKCGKKSGLEKRRVSSLGRRRLGSRRCCVSRCAPGPQRVRGPRAREEVLPDCELGPRDKAAPCGTSRVGGVQVLTLVMLIQVTRVRSCVAPAPAPLVDEEP